jgi:subtilisin family serine protease
MRATAALAVAFVLAVVSAATASPPRPAGPAVLVELEQASAPALADLRSAGATRVAAEPAIWKLTARAAPRLVPRLEQAGLVRSLARDVVVTPLGAGATTQPGSEWWRTSLRATGLTPPGPGKPVTVVDTGLDFSHPEFAGRPDTIALNRQQITSPDDFHGTAISSLIGAQGKKLLGIYPRARLDEWDASEQDGLVLSAIIAGIEAATRLGPGVINLSFGSDADVPMLRDVILEAIRKGSVVVAASGDSRGLDFSPYPAEYPHVLTVGAVDRRDQVAEFSSPSSSIDVAAPGVGVEVAVPGSHDPSGYVSANGTSYSAALVSGALAWIWTRRPHLDNSQLTTLVRRTARPVSPGGVSNDTGYGVLDLRAALSAAAPPPDPLEPNDDIALVRPGALFADGSPLLVSARRRSESLQARVDQNKDPADVYRASIPANGAIAVTVRTLRGDVGLRVWGPRTPTILERGPIEKRDLLVARALARPETVKIENRHAAAETVYVAVSAGISRTASYSLRLVVRTP